MKQKMTLMLLSSIASTVLTGCASTFHPFGDDHLTITGTPAGFDSFWDGVDGVSQTAKGDVHTATNHARHQHDKELTKRAALTLSLGKSEAHE